MGVAAPLGGMLGRTGGVLAYWARRARRSGVPMLGTNEPGAWVASASSLKPRRGLEMSTGLEGGLDMIVLREELRPSHVAQARILIPPHEQQCTSASPEPVPWHNGSRASLPSSTPAKLIKLRAHCLSTILTGNERRLYSKACAKNVGTNRLSAASFMSSTRSKAGKA
jgi:hypothetical protein